MEIHAYFGDGSDWQQRGVNIDGDDEDWSGNSIALSSDGTIISIGSIEQIAKNIHIIMVQQFAQKTPVRHAYFSRTTRSEWVKIGKTLKVPAKTSILDIQLQFQQMDYCLWSNIE